MILRGNRWIEIKIWPTIKSAFGWKNQKLLWAAYSYWVIFAFQYFLFWFLFDVYIPWDHSNELTARLIEALTFLCGYLREFLTVLISLMCAYYNRPESYGVCIQYCVHLGLIITILFLFYASV